MRHLECLLLGWQTWKFLLSLLMIYLVNGKENHWLLHSCTNISISVSSFPFCSNIIHLYITYFLSWVISWGIYQSYVQIELNWTFVCLPSYVWSGKFVFVFVFVCVCLPSYDLVNLGSLYIAPSVLANRIGHAITSPPFPAGRDEI